MIEILWQYDPETATHRLMPATAEAALRELAAGNREFAETLERADAGIPSPRRVVHLVARDLGLTNQGDTAPEQLPFAAALSCADALCAGRDDLVAGSQRSLCRARGRQ